MKIIIVCSIPNSEPRHKYILSYSYCCFQLSTVEFHKIHAEYRIWQWIYTVEIHYSTDKMPLYFRQVPKSFILPTIFLVVIEAKRFDCRIFPGQKCVFLYVHGEAKVNFQMDFRALTSGILTCIADKTAFTVRLETQPIRCI